MDLSVFSSSEAVELILGCYTFTLGFWEDELDKLPEARKFVELGLTQPNEEYPDLQVRPRPCSGGYGNGSIWKYPGRRPKEECGTYGECLL